MNANVLITGGTGLIGSRLTELLRQKGYQVSYLSRSKGDGEIKKYQWDIRKKTIDQEALKHTDFIVNLAGANLFEKKWTKEFKKEIIESRTESVNLIYHHLKNSPYSVKAFISSSAIGYYGADTGYEIINENGPAGDDFLSEVVQKWEASVSQMESLKIRTVKLRIGIVLSEKAGALKELLNPIRKGAGVVLASGKQYVSWIHIDDVCYMFIKAIEDENLHGVYNAVAPFPVRNEEFTKVAAAKVNRSILLPHVPEFALKFLLGSERAKILIGGNNVSSEKIVKEGFNFKFQKLDDAMNDLLK